MPLGSRCPHGQIFVVMNGALPPLPREPDIKIASSAWKVSCGRSRVCDPGTATSTAQDTPCSPRTRAVIRPGSWCKVVLPADAEVIQKRAGARTGHHAFDPTIRAGLCGNHITSRQFPSSFLNPSYKSLDALTVRTLMRTRCRI